MISLGEYKEYLVNYYRHECDNNEIKRQVRNLELSKKYPDELLQKIINDTYAFIKDIFNSPTVKDGYCYFELEEDTTSYISLNITGGGFADTLFTDLQGRMISRHILKKVFGNLFYIDIKEDEIPFETKDEFIMSFNYRYSLYMQDFPKNMNEIKQKIFGQSKQLIKRCPKTKQ